MAKTSIDNRASKVFWKHGEKIALAQRIEQLLFEVGGYSKMQALYKAQEELLELPRRRTVASWSVAGKALDTLIAEAHAQRLRLVKERVDSSAIEQQQLTAHNLEAAQKQINEFKLETWLAQSAELLAPLLVQILRHPLVATELAKFTTGKVATAAPTPAADSDNSWMTAVKKDCSSGRPKILVAGLLPIQAGEISRELGDKIELKFWSSDESKDRLKILSKHCHVAVGVTNFISHPADASMKALAPKYVRYTGGVTRLKDTLREVLASELALTG